MDSRIGIQLLNGLPHFDLATKAFSKNDFCVDEKSKLTIQKAIVYLANGRTLLAI